MRFTFVSDLARRFGVKPRVISGLFYDRVLDDADCPVVSGRRLIPKAADFLRISPRLLWTLSNRGDIRCRRIARRVLYRPEKLREYAARPDSATDWNGGSRPTMSSKMPKKPRPRNRAPSARDDADGEGVAVESFQAFGSLVSREEAIEPP